MSYPRPNSNELAMPRRISSLKLEKPSGTNRLTTGLIASAPLEALLATFSTDIATIKRMLPNSSDLATLERLRDGLERALSEARRADVWLTPSEVAAHTGKGLSTVTRDCREHGETVGGVRNGKRG